MGIFDGVGNGADFIVSLSISDNKTSTISGVTGGAAGVGRATTSTVVQAIVAIIIADFIFTAIFYSLGWT